MNELHEEFFLTDKIQDPVLSDLLHEIAVETIEAEKERQLQQDSNEVEIIVVSIVNFLVDGIWNGQSFQTFFSLSIYFSVVSYYFCYFS